MTFLRSLRAIQATTVRSGSDRGATAIEYALLVAGVAIVMIVGVAFLGSSIGAGVASAAGAMTTGAGSTGEADPAAAEQAAAEQAAAEQAASEQAAAEQAAAEQARIASERSAEEARIAAEQAAAAEAARVAAQQAPAVRSCSPTSSFDYDGSGREGNEYRSPIKCDTTNGTWVCPSGFKLLTMNAKATCQKK